MDVNWVEEAKVTATRTLRWVNIDLGAERITANIGATVQMDSGAGQDLPPQAEHFVFADCTPEVQKAIQYLMDVFSAQIQANAVKNPTLEVGMVAVQG